ncbi:MAG TPA: YihY/virulence factor BrkB family protein [Chthoniobacteraceae bacterium]
MMKSESIGLRGYFGLFKQAGMEFSRDNAMRLSAALSYYALFSLSPTLLIIIGLIGRFYGQKAAEGKIATQLSDFMGPQTAEAVQSIVKSASHGGSGVTIIGFAVMLFGASTFFGQLQNALNAVWKVRPKSGLGLRSFIGSYLSSFSLILAVGILLLASLLAATIVAGLGGWLEAHFGPAGAAAKYAGICIPPVLEFVLFAAIFRVLPNAEIQWRSVGIGALVTAILFEIGKIGLSYYFATGTATSSFGAAGSVVLILLWVYYVSCIFLYGAEFTQVYAHEMGHCLRPSPIAEPTEVWTAKGRLPIECAEISGATTAAGVPIAGPRHESLAPLLAPAEAPAPGPEQPPTRIRLWKNKADLHPVAEFSAAIGAGLVAGIFLRLLGSPKSR